MKWTIRDSRLCKLFNPTRQEIDALVGRLSQLEPPVLILESERGDYVEVASTGRAAFIVSYSVGGENACSVETSLPPEAVSDLLDLCLQGDEDWRSSVAWRPFSWPDEDSPEATKLASWLAALAVEVSHSGPGLSEEAQEWVLRRLVRKSLAERLPVVFAAEEHALRAPLSYDLERFLMSLARDATAEPDA